MGKIGVYILSVTAAGIICGIAKTLLSNKGGAAEMGKLLVGVFFTIAVVQPLINIEFVGLDRFIDGISADGKVWTDSGINMSQEAVSDIIKDRVEAYILDKANDMHANLSVEVSVEPGTPPQLSEVVISGDVSPYVRERLNRMITEELGLTEEQQIWNGQD